MRRTSKLLCILLVASMLLSLAACGGGKPADPNLLKVGKYELLYKGACIMKDYDGNDALVLTLDYTNNTDEFRYHLRRPVCGCHARRDSGNQKRLCTY